MILLEIHKVLIYTFLVTLILLMALNFLWPVYLKKFMDNEKGIQKINKLPTIRMGGITIFLSTFFVSNVFISLDKTFYVFYYCLLPLIIVSLIEDLTLKTTPKLRFYTILISSIILVISSKTTLTNIDILFLDALFNFYIFSIIFTSIGISATSNAFNFIDGINGLASGLSIIILSSFSYLSHINSFNEFSYFLQIIIISIICFWIVNVFYGKIILGDTGSYFFGILIGWSGVYLTVQNTNISPWLIFTIIIYPATEICFSVIRRTLSGSSPMLADNLHLHSIFYYIMKNKLIKLSNNMINSISGLILIFYGSIPIITILIINKSFTSYILCISIFVLSYTIFYYLLTDIKNRF